LKPLYMSLNRSGVIPVINTFVMQYSSVVADLTLLQKALTVFAIPLPLQAL